MRWLCRCGTAFVTTSVEVPSAAEPELLHVVLEQTEARLLGAPRSDGLSDVHEHPVLQALSDSLAEAELDWVGRRFDFHQPLPKGLFAIVLSRCANLCDSRSSFWRRELRAVMGSAPCVPRMPCPAPAPRMPESASGCSAFCQGRSQPNTGGVQNCGLAAASGVRKCPFWPP